MLPYIDLDKLLLNSLLVSLWYSISFQSICADIFSFTLNLTAAILKLVKIDVWSLRIPMLTTLQSLTRRKNSQEIIQLSRLCGDLIELKDRRVV